MTAKKEIRREYLAIVSGKPEESGTIDLPIARKDGSTIERCIDMDHGEHAVTHYRCLDYRDDLGCSLVRLRLETGRTHQIRVHTESHRAPAFRGFSIQPGLPLHRTAGASLLYGGIPASDHRGSNGVYGSDAGGFFLLLLNTASAVPSDNGFSASRRSSCPNRANTRPHSQGTSLFRRLPQKAGSSRRAGMPPSPARRHDRFTFCFTSDGCRASASAWDGSKRFFLNSPI